MPCFSISAADKELKEMKSSCLSLIHKLLQDLHPRDFAVRLWDGSSLSAEEGQPTRYTIAINNPAGLRRMFLRPSELSLGESYVYGDFEIEGEMEYVFRLADYILGLRPSLIEKMRYIRFFMSLQFPAAWQIRRRKSHAKGKLHSVSRDRRAVTFHYDISNDFYALWLDKKMIYSCAYFSDPAQDLDKAQERKLDYICRKLRLKKGERFLDIGCGWGGLIIHAAAMYGVNAIGITLSRPQAELANDRIQRAGLSDRCSAMVLDYRELDEPAGFDKMASVGMFEHVGESMLPDYFRQAWLLMRPGGAFLNHGIACRPGSADRGESFVDRYVFPDGELVPVSTTLRIAEKTGFEVRDVESLREHYTLTLREWVRSLEEHRDEARHFAGDIVFRVWRLYMSGAAYGFDIGRNNIYQALLVKPENGKSGLPLTRDDWY
jgi:cyclopropane-fatty-acyl-phospholipid synthase